MSPDEDQLRAALRGGEDDGGLDAGAIMRKAIVGQQQRRRTMRNVAASVAAVVLVGGAGFGISQIHVGTEQKSSSAGQADSAVSSSAAARGDSEPSKAASSSGAGTAGPAAGVPGPTSAGAASLPANGAVPGPVDISRLCPAVAYALPSDRPAPSLTRPLFPADITTMTVCIYQPGGSPLAGAKKFTTAEARSIAASFNASARYEQDQACTADLGPTVVMYASTASDPALPTVVGYTGGCGTTSSVSATRAARPALMKLIAQILPTAATGGKASPGPGPAS
jgi:hypothetical protein